MPQSLVQESSGHLVELEPIGDPPVLVVSAVAAAVAAVAAATLHFCNFSDTYM